MSMLKKNRSIVFLFSIAFLIVAAILVLQNTKEEDTSIRTLENPSLRLKWVVYSSFAHHFVALEKGFYKDEGLNVTIEPGGAGIDPIKLVASGQNDFGLASYAQILLAREKGIPVIAIAEEYITSGVVSMSLKNSNITTPYDFAGKKVGIIPGSDTWTIYHALLKKLNIDKNNITEIPVGSDLKVLFDGVVDVSTVGYITNQPIVAEERGFPVNVINPRDYGINSGGNVIFTTEEKLAENKALVKRFLKATLKGIIVSQDLNSSEVVNLVLKHNDKLNKDSELKIWEATKKHLLNSNPKTVGLMPQKTWEETALLFSESGLLKNIPNLKESYTNEIVQEILNEGI